MRDVVIGYLHGDLITTPFHHSLLRTFIYDLCNNNRILNFIPVYASVNIGGPRNRIVREFLDGSGEWLWMLDTDATFDGDLLDRLLDVADPTDIPILGALTHRLQDTGTADPSGMPVRSVVPVAYQDTTVDGELVGYSTLTAHTGDGLLEVDETGCHCLLIHRDVLTKMTSDHPYPWFSETILPNGTTCGEDITFCRQARQAGFPIHIDTRLEAGHAKMMVLTSRGAS